MQVNARSVFLGCKLATSEMLRQEIHESGDRGWIINIGSITALVGCPILREYPSLYFGEMRDELRLYEKPHTLLRKEP